MRVVRDKGGNVGFGDMVDKAKDLATSHSGEAKQGIDEAADMADSATDGKASGHIDTAADKAKDFIDDQKG
jgi:hypothetical protein